VEFVLKSEPLALIIRDASIGDVLQRQIEAKVIISPALSGVSVQLNWISIECAVIGSISVRREGDSTPLESASEKPGIATLDRFIVDPSDQSKRNTESSASVACLVHLDSPLEVEYVDIVITPAPTIRPAAQVESVYGLPLILRHVPVVRRK
jgi:hypothetical protein